MLLAGAWCAAEAAEDFGKWHALRELPTRSTVEQAEAEWSEVYAPFPESVDWVRFEPETAWLRMSDRNPGFWLELPWPAPESEPASGSRGLLPVGDDPHKPFEGWRVALDPGHLGGEWGPMERRSFALVGQGVVQEGDLVHAAARRLRSLLEAGGAEVILLHEAGQPATDRRPIDFYEECFRDLLRETGEMPAPEQVQRLAELRFYRLAEIRARADRVAEWKPDLVIAMHLDAAAWPDPEQPSPVTVNYGHVLINGAYLPSELRDDAQRWELAQRWRMGYGRIERELGETLAETMAELCGLPPFSYRGSNAVQVGENPYLWARNLMANRTFAAPVVYLEPWVLNNGEVYSWALLGDYEGEQTLEDRIDAVPRLSLPATYAKFVEAGLRRWVENRRAAGE